MNSILWNNHAPDGPEIFVESGTIDVSYSDVKGGWTGTGNINQLIQRCAISLFVKTQFTLY